MTRVLAVTGAAGFLGRRLIDLARAEYDRVVAIDLVPVQADDVVTPVIADITVPGALDAAFAGVDTVFHAAALVDVRPRPDSRMEAVNVEGTRNVVASCRRAGVARLVHTSSMDVCVDGAPKRDADESTPYPAAPANHYIRTKIEAERLALAANDPPRLATCALRPTGIYGPHDRHRVEALARLVRSGELSLRFGDGRSRFDHVYVDNVVHAHLLAARALGEPGSRVAGEAYFVGDHPTGNFYTFLEPFFEAAGVRLPARALPFGVAIAAATLTEWIHGAVWSLFPSFNPQFSRYVVRSMAQDLTFSYAKATRDFDYRPLVPLDQAVRRTAAWARESGL